MAVYLPYSVYKYSISYICVNFCNSNSQPNYQVDWKSGLTTSVSAAPRAGGGSIDEYLERKWVRYFGNSGLPVGVGLGVDGYRAGGAAVAGAMQMPMQMQMQMPHSSGVGVGVHANANGIASGSSSWSLLRTPYGLVSSGTATAAHSAAESAAAAGPGIDRQLDEHRAWLSKFQTEQHMSVAAVSASSSAAPKPASAPLQRTPLLPLVPLAPLAMSSVCPTCHNSQSSPPASNPDAAAETYSPQK